MKLKLSHVFILILLISSYSCNRATTNQTASQTDENSNVSTEEKKYSQAFSALMEQAKKHENDKHLILALNTYYNAIEVSVDMEEANIAYAEYNELAEIIEGGRPGRGTFDSLSLYEEWKKLLVETEEFGNSRFPYELYFGSFIAENYNLNEKKADYEVPIMFHLSNRYLRTVGVVSKGYSLANKNGWTELPEVFPGNPISNDSLAIEFKSNKTSSFAYSIGNLSFPDGNCVIPYEGIFIIEDNNGNELAQSEPYVIGTKLSEIKSSGLLPGIFSYQPAFIPFKDVPESVIREIDRGNAHVQLKTISILYGKIQAENDIDAKRYIKGESKKEISFYIGDVHCQGSRQVSWATAVFASHAIKKNGYLEPVGCLMLEPKEMFNLIFTEDDVSLNTTNFIILCNEFSKMMGRTPVYTINGSSEVCDIVLNISSEKLSFNQNANGYRAPTLKDIDKSLSLLKDAPPLEKKSGWFFDSYNYYIIEENPTNDANLLVYFRN